MTKKIVPDSAAVQKKNEAMAMLRKAMPATRQVAAESVAKQTGLTIATLRRWVDRMHTDGEVHIIKYIASGNSTLAPVYALGYGDDIAVPPRYKAQVANLPLNANGDLAHNQALERARNNADHAAANGCAWLNQFRGIFSSARQGAE